METLKAPLNVWNKHSIRPGPVGSVGDVLLQVKLKTSCPGMAQRYDYAFSKDNEKYHGSNVTDGHHANFTTGGGPATVVEKPMGYRPGFKTAVGWIHQDIRAVDRARTSMMGPVGSVYSEQVAQLQRAKATGELFLPLPNGYAPKDGEVGRGSQTPRVTAVTYESTLLPPMKPGKVTDIEYGTRPPTTRPTQVPEYVVDPSVYWTVPADDPRRFQDPVYTHRVRYVYRNRYAGSNGHKIEWLPDSKDPQEIWDLSRQSYFTGIANRTGGILRPKGEIVPMVEQKVPGPTPGNEPIPGNAPSVSRGSILTAKNGFMRV